VAQISTRHTLSKIGHAQGYATADMTKGNDSFTHRALLVMNGLGVVLLLSRSGWTRDALTCIFRDGMHVRRWHINMAHEDNLSMREEIQLWKMPPSLRGSVRYLQLQAVILQKKVQEDPSTPLQKPQEEVEDPRREVDPAKKIIIKLKTRK
jgi:hypothetical protein